MSSLVPQEYDEFIPLERIRVKIEPELLLNDSFTEDNSLPIPETVNLKKLHKSLGINFEKDPDEPDDELEDGDDDDLPEENTYVEETVLPDFNPILIEDEQLDENAEEIAKNFQRFLEMDEYSASDDYEGPIEPEVILAETDDRELFLNEYDQKKPYKCNICGREVVSRYNLKRHMMIHTGEKPHHCEICHKRFREYSDVRKHKKVHTTRIEFSCKICFRNVPSKKDSNKCHYCETDNQYLITPKIEKLDVNDDDEEDDDENGDEDLEEDEIEMKMEIPDKPKEVRIRKRRSYICHVCNKVFGSSHNLKRHIMIHTGEKPFKCKENLCDKEFREFNCLRKHIHSVHGGQKPHKCEICSKLFSDVSSLNKHKLIHSNDHHECSICGKKFNYSSNLFKHFRIHTGEKPYKCRVCGKDFRSKHHMQSHVLIHFKS